MDYDELSEPSACIALLDSIKVSNDTIRQFLDDILPQLQWNLIPYSFLYDCYRSWKDNNCPAGMIESKLTFTTRVKELLKCDDNWEPCEDAVTTGVKMNNAEPLIIRYQLSNWYNPYYHGNDPDKIALPALKSSYRGIKRR